MVQYEMGTKMDHTKYMSMFKPDVEDFFQSFNAIIAEEYGFQDKGSKRNLDDIQLGAVMNPCFGAGGEFLGF